mgnify:CR=1 FL=1
MNRTGGERIIIKGNGGRECTRTVCGNFLQNDGAEAAVVPRPPVEVDGGVVGVGAVGDVVAEDAGVVEDAGLDPGALLVVSKNDSDDKSRATKFREVPGAFVATSAFLVVPAYAIFGSDELSNASWPIAQRMPAPFALLNVADADKLGVQAGEGISGTGLTTSLEVRIDDRIPAGLVGVVQGLPGTHVTPTGRVELSVDSDFVPRPGGHPDVIARG